LSFEPFASSHQVPQQEPLQQAPKQQNLSVLVFQLLAWNNALSLRSSARWSGNLSKQHIIDITVLVVLLTSIVWQVLECL
jgi:hypothetical protein